MTVKEIAELAGVSIGTVDRVLHGRGRVSEETKQRIQKIIAEGDYKPNPIARHLKRKKNFSFAIIMPEARSDESYWSLTHEGIKKAKDALAPFSIELHLLEFDRYKKGDLITKLEDSRKRKFDGLLLAPVNREEIEYALNKETFSIPYVFFDCLVPDLTPLCIVGQDGYQSGALAARLMNMLIEPKARLLLVNPHKSDLHLQNRMKGFKDYFSKFKGISITEFNPSELEHGKVDENDRQLVDNANGIFVVNAAAAVFMQAYMKNTTNQLEQKPLIGYDLVPENVAALRSGKISCLISQRPEFQSYEGIMALYKHCVLGEKNPPHLEAPIDVYFPENLPPEL